MNAEEFLQDVYSWFPWAKTTEDAQKPYAIILSDQAKAMFSQFSQAEVIRIGGTDGGSPEENWLAVQDDSFFYVCFHCSG